MKRKNKLILVLCCIPILISCLVLPLCSFVNIESNTSYVFEPLYDVAIGYDYHINTSTTNKHYFGYIEKYNRLLSSDESSLNEDDVVFDSSGYNILGSPSLKINYSSFSSGKSYLSSLSGDYILGLNLVTSGGNTERKLNFNGKIRISGFLDSVEIDKYYIDFPNYNYPSPTSGRILCHVTADYVYSDSGNNLVDSIKISVKPSISLSYGISVGSIYSSVIDSISNPDFIYISSLSLYFVDISNSQDISARPILTDSVTVRCPIYSSYDKVSASTDSSGNYFYNLGYTNGVNYGRSTAPEVWDNLAEFLDSTVGDFMEAKLFPGFTIETVLGILVGAVLLVSFLKLFAGG